MNKILAGKNLAHQTSPPSKAITIYYQNILEEYFYTYLMRLIQLQHPFCHSVLSYSSICQNISDFPIFRMGPQQLHSPLRLSLLLSECTGRVFLYLYNILNRIVSSICCSDSWLWSYRQK